MTGEERADARRQNLGLVLIVVGVAAVIPTSMAVSWALSEALWFLIDHKGWPRAAAGAVLAAAGIIYAIHTHRRTP